MMIDEKQQKEKRNENEEALNWMNVVSLKIEKANTLKRVIFPIKKKSEIK